MRGSFGAKLVASARAQFAANFLRYSMRSVACTSSITLRLPSCGTKARPRLIHGDTHAGNQFSDGDDVGLYDWAVVSRSPGIRDIAIYLGNSCPTDLRRAGQDAWLRRYHEVLTESGVAAPPLSTLWDRYRRCVLYAWVAAATTASMGSKWQPIEVGMLGMQRATEACADLDTIGALRRADLKSEMTGLTETFATGLDFAEGPRWHGGRLWLSDFYAQRVYSYGPTGDRRVEVELDDRPSGLGWLPSGELLLVAMASPTSPPCGS